MLQSLNLRDVLNAHRCRRIDLAPRTLAQYEHALNAFEKWNHGPVLLSSLCDQLVLMWLACMKDDGQAARTINSKRMGVLILWREAKRLGLVDTSPQSVPRMKVPKRAATAWTVEEVSRILAHCDAGIPKRWARSRRYWTTRHWQALVLTIYDTSLRLNPLLLVPRRCADTDRRILIVPGEHTKNGQDEVHRLHPQTCALLSRLPLSDLLFAWPKHRRAIWRDFRRILFAAGLPCGYRDLFHKLRRTSYTHVYRSLGLAAASEHAGHQSDLSAAYLDKTLLDLPDAISVLPRPRLD
jgi:integrase